MKTLHDRLKENSYGFLRENPDLSRIIYLTAAGSYGYGTHNENSDLDLRGVLLENEKYLFGLKEYEQFENRETDTVIYGLKKFMRLCLDANPNILELLGTEEDCIILMTAEGKLLRENRNLFLSRRVIESFGNYAVAQLRRLQNALQRDALSEQEKTGHLQRTLSTQLKHFEKAYPGFKEGFFRIYMDEESGELYFDARLEKYPLKDFANIYSEINNTVKTYKKLRCKNRKKEEENLYKHAMHLVRLLITGTDILNGKGIITKRKAEHSLLMDIRSGKYGFEEIFTLVNQYQEAFERAAQSTKLPEKPDTEKTEALMLRLYCKTAQPQP